jgi:hypothetical protein
MNLNHIPPLADWDGWSIEENRYIRSWVNWKMGSR